MSPQGNPAPSTERTLRRLFLTLFLRGRSSRGIQKGSTPSTVGSKLFLTLATYALVGLLALMFAGQPVFALSVYLHAMTFVFTGMFVAASSGEVLFNKEEADILLHRPVMPRALLWAKVGVLVRVSLWLAAAFNAAGSVVGAFAPGGAWWYPLVHAVSTSVEALFCTALVVVVYQLCLRWFGRERLDGVMTTAQVLIAVGTVLSGQLLPRMMRSFDGKSVLRVDAWWIGFLPPAWFAGFDDALAGSRAAGSWWLAAAGLLATGVALWLAFGVLARDYGAGLQTLGEFGSPPPQRAGHRRLLHVLVQVPPLKWWLRDSVSRASFLLTAAYLARDRDVKLRVYPGIAPILIMPFVFVFQDSTRRSDSGFGGFGLAIAGSCLALVPAFGLKLLRYSQQWQASDLFRAAPLPGPAPLCHGARRAVLLFLGLPLIVCLGGLSWVLQRDISQLVLLLPGMIALPVLSLIPCLGGNAVPLSLASEEATAAGRSLHMLGMMVVAMALSGVALWARAHGWFWWLILAESLAAVGIRAWMRASIASARWPPME